MRIHSRSSNAIARGRRFAACLIAVTSVWAGCVFAQTGNYPARPIRIIVPTPPGGGADIATRLIAKRMAENVGQPVLVENRAGAGGNVAADYVAKQPADGYTLYMGAIGPLAISPSLYPSLPYDPVRDFAPITLSVVLSNILVAHPTVAAGSAGELITLARAKPGALNFGSSGTGTAGHLAGELFASMAGVTLVHVPYKGGGPAMADLLAGQIQLIFASTPSALPHVKSGKLKAYGVTTSQRLSALPDLPTLAEAAPLPGFEATNWYCFVAPAKTSSELIKRLNAEFHRALTDPETRDALLVQGLEPSPTTPEQLGAYIKTEIAKWQKLIRERRLTAQ